MTLFEALEDAGLVTATVNFTAYRGRVEHRSSVPLFGSVRGPRRFFFYNVFESDETGAPLSWRNRSAGTIDAYAAAVGALARHARRLRLPPLLPLRLRLGLARARARTPRSTSSRGVTRRSARSWTPPGGLDELLARYAARRPGRPRSEPRPLGDAARGALRRCRGRARGGVEPGRSGLPARRLPARRRPSWPGCSTATPAVDVSLRREGAEAVARKDGEELRFAPAPEPAGCSRATPRSSRHPDGLRRAWTALGQPERGRAAGLPGRRGRVRRSRRAAPSCRRLARLVAARGQRGAGRSRSASRGASAASSISPRSSCGTSASRSRRMPRGLGRAA